MANENLGASFSIDTTNLKAGLAQANRMIRESESEFKAAAAGMDDWAASEDGLNAKIKSLNDITELQRKKVDALQGEYDNLIENGLDPASREATELRTKINNETAALNKNEAELKKQTQALEELENGAEEAGDAAEEMGDKFSGLKAAGGIAVGAIAAVGAACVAAVGSFLSLAESTRESRNEMAKLDTAFQTAGLSAQNAENTFTALYGIMGDEGAATEAAQQLAKFSKNEKDLAINTQILTGVMAEYGTTIPTEGLAEGMAATVAMGEVQGSLADALEWQGVNLEDYNAKLATLTTEEERAAYIQSTLYSLYGASAAAYRENNAEVIAAQEAQANLNNAINELGAIAEPIMTTLKTLAADLLSTITPFVSLIGEGLAGALTGADGAADTLAEGISGLIETALNKIVEIAPFLIQTVVSLFPQLLETILSQLPAILKTLLLMVNQTATSLGEMLPTLIPLVIDTVILLVETLLDNIDLIIDAGMALIMGLADGLLAALPKLIDKAPVLIDKLISALTSNLPKILRMGVDLVVKLGTGLIEAIPQLASKIPQIVSSIVNGLITAIPQLIAAGGDLLAGLFKGLLNPQKIWEAVKGLFNGIVGGIKSIFGIHSPSKVMADIVGKNLALGIGEGFADNIGAVNADIASAINLENLQNTNGLRGGGIGGGVVVNQYNTYAQAHTRYELYKSKQQTAAAVRLAMAGG